MYNTDSFSLLPRWPGLDNLEKVVNITFADGKTHMSILKVCLRQLDGDMFSHTLTSSFLLEDSTMCPRHAGCRS